MHRPVKQCQTIKPVRKPDPHYTTANVYTLTDALVKLNRLHWELETLKTYINNQPELGE